MKLLASVKEKKYLAAGCRGCQSRSVDDSQVNCLKILECGCLL